MDISSTSLAAIHYGERVDMMRLEPLAESHLPALAALLEDPDVQRFSRVPVPTPPDFPRTWLRLYEEGRRDGTREAFAVVHGDGTFLGIAVAQINREGRTAELGYLVVPAARGRGVATEALRLLSEWGFSELGALRLELLISADNVASKRVAARSGYLREGLLRSAYVKQNLRADTEIWSRLPGDPAARDETG